MFSKVNNEIDNAYLPTLVNNVTAWHYEKGIILPDNEKIQVEKLQEEFDEMKEALLENNPEHLAEEFGDMLVVLINLMERRKMTVEHCLESAHNKNRGRRGQTIEGSFIKEADL